MTVASMQPFTAIDWEKVSQVRVTLEKPFKGGGLRWRQGTSDAKKNLTYNAMDDSSGPPYWPGSPIMYPDDAPAIAGDASRDSFIMPLQAALTAFGYFFAPLEVPRNGLMGFTISGERERVAAYWNNYKMPNGDGTMHPPMNRIGPPDVPAVAIRPLSKNLTPMELDGQEVVIRPRAFFDFDNANHYDQSFAGTPAVSERAQSDAAKLLEAFSADDISALLELAKAKQSRGKGK